MFAISSPEGKAQLATALSIISPFGTAVRFAMGAGKKDPLGLSPLSRVAGIGEVGGVSLDTDMLGSGTKESFAADSKVGLGSDIVAGNIGGQQSLSDPDTGPEDPGWGDPSGDWGGSDDEGDLGGYGADFGAW